MIKINEIFKALSSLKSDKKLLVIAAVAVLGIILSVISTSSDASENLGSEPEVTSSFKEIEYTQQLEKKLETLIAAVYGAGRTMVTVTLECDYETIYARDGSYSVKDGASDEQSEYIIIDSNKQEGGLVLKTVTPKVRGVAVLCEGGDLPRVQNTVCEMLEALLGVSSNHISVSKIQ